MRASLNRTTVVAVVLRIHFGDKSRSERTVRERVEVRSIRGQSTRLVDRNGMGRRRNGEF